MSKNSDHKTKTHLDMCWVVVNIVIDQSMSKRFIVNKIRPVKSIFTYVVEANNEEEALNKALEGDFLSLDKELEEFDTISRYDVYEEGKG